MVTSRRKPAYERASVWILCFVAAFILLIWLAPARTPQEDAASSAQVHAEQGIDGCWQQQGRKSLTPETQRVIAGACEEAEDDYRRSYGRYYKRYGQKP